MNTTVIAADLSVARRQPAPKPFYAWVGRASAVLMVGGAASVQFLRAPVADASVGQAWGLIAATLATAVGVVCGIAAVTSEMNDH